MSETEVIRHSVTRGDQEDARSGSGFHLILPRIMGGLGDPAALPSILPAYWSLQRDAILGATTRHEDLWAVSVSRAITKQAALGFTIEDANDSDRRVARAQDLLLHCDGGQGWIPFISRHLRSVLLRNNGAFIEVVRASSDKGSRILGLMHLSSLRCRRTGDPDEPVIYTDRRGHEHVLKWYQVLAYADQPSDEDLWFGVGECAADRAYKTIFKIAAMELYLREKMSGDGATELSIIQGVTDRQLRDAITISDEERAQRGVYLYKGKVMIALQADGTINVLNVPLKNVPDGFNAKEERDHAVIIYAGALGVPVQEIKPLSGQGLGTGTQTEILDDAAQASGTLPAWRKWFEHTVGEDVLSETTTVKFAVSDTRDQKAKAEVSEIRAKTRATQIASGEISAQQSLQMAADVGDVPKIFLAEDQTPGGSLSDTEKPVDDDVREGLSGASAGASAPNPSALMQAIQNAARRQKAERDYLDDPAVLEEARKLYEEITNGGT